MRRLLRSAYQRRSLAHLRTRHVDLRRRGLDLGLRMVVASDLHARDDWFDRSLVAQVVDAINAVDGVDVVALLGDFVGDELEPIDWSAAEYARIDAPTVAVLGNHDHWVDAAHIEGALSGAGIEVLGNRALPFHQVVAGHGTSAWLAGVDSCWSRARDGVRGADVDAALQDVPEDVEVVVLGHEPHIATMHAHVLHVAGHTHCGQVRSPLLGDWTARLHMPRFSEPYPTRLYELDVADAAHLPASHRTGRAQRFVYTSAGVGYSTVDWRLLCPPELIVLDL